MLNRRALLQSLTAFAAAPLLATARPREHRRPRVAALCTEWRFRSHTYNILENFFQPYLFRGKLVDPGVDVVSLYVDQFPDNDMARPIARQLGVPLHATIDKALCQGGDQLDVDAVLLIGEHGDYPINQRGQKMYPRKEFFDQAVASMHRSGRYVPLFNDKHLSYRWDWAREMYDTARSTGMPLMAGSSVPLAQRVPAIMLPRRSVVTEALVVHGGGIESYDFHGLEVLQSIIEARRGGETGVKSVQLITGQKAREALATGRISPDLLHAALETEISAGFVRQPRPGKDRSTLPPALRREQMDQLNHALLVDYVDGTRAAVVTVGSDSNRWNFACRLKGESQPRATAFFNGPWGNRCLFKALSHSIQHLFKTGRQPYPVERTLLVSGILDHAMTSLEQGGAIVDTPQLEFSYRPINFDEMREDGTSWDVITVDSPQPAEFEPGDARWLK
jgi:hypothetical protein